MGNPSKTTRTILRRTHVLAGLPIGALVYTPARSSETFVLLMQAAVLPAVTLTGARMWQQARLRSLYRRLRNNPRRTGTNGPKPPGETRRGTAAL